MNQKVTSNVTILVQHFILCAGVLLIGLPSTLAGESFLCAGFRSEERNLALTGAAAKPTLQPVVGTRGAIVLFAQFRGEGSGPVPAWSAEIFDAERPGSFSHFFATMSLGQLQVTGEVAPRRYVSAQEAAAYVATTPTENALFGRFSEEILRQADADLDFARFDNDGSDGVPNSGDDDGVVDAVFIVLSSTPTNFLLGPATGIGTLGFKELFVVTDDRGWNGNFIRISNDQGTLQQGRTLVEAVGSMCHEYGHVLGLPDLFNQAFLQERDAPPEQDSAGIGAWGLMGWGALGWNGDDGPNSFCAWSRQQLGWTAVVEIGSGTQNIRLAEVGTGGPVIKLPLDKEEYFLLEHRRTSSYYDRHLPGEGLLIWHVRLGGTGLGASLMLDLECADGRWRQKGYPLGQEADPLAGGDNLDFWAHDATYAAAHEGNLGDATDPFDGVQFTAFTPATNPASYRADGQLGARVEHIRFEEGLVLADVEAAPRLVGSARLRSPEDLAVLSGLEGRVFEATGDLSVSGSEFVSLEGLRGLSLVDGNMIVRDNTALTSLEGLNDLVHVGLNLVIRSNAALIGLQGLSNLTHVGRDVVIEVNGALTSLEGLNNLTKVERDLLINSNGALPSLQGLNNLTHIEGGLEIDTNGALLNLEELNNLTQVGRNLVIRNNAALLSLQGLNNLTHIEGRLEIDTNGALLNLEELNNLTQVGRNLVIRNNAALLSLQGLNNLTHIEDGLEIDTNGALLNLEELNSLTQVGGNLVIRNNAALLSLQGLNNLTHFEGDLEIDTNGALLNLEELNNLTQVGGNLVIRNNAALLSLQGLNNLTHIEGDLEINTNGALLNLEGLNNLTQVGGNLVIRNNAALLSLQGLNNLTHIEGDLAISGNGTLTSIKSLHNLTHVGGNVAFSGNTALASLEGVSALLRDRILHIGFARKTDYDLPGGPAGLFAADFDGDGDSDVAAAVWQRDVVSVLLNNGDATLAPSTEYATGNSPLTIASADFDRDSDLDLAVANQSNLNVSVLLNNGDGSFAPRVDYTSAAGSQGIFSADFDGDGDMDLATANCGGNNVSVLLNNDDGSFTPTADYEAANCPVEVFSADFDGDGDQDLTVGHAGSSVVSMLLNRGDGSFAPKVDYAGGTNTVADLDGDGDLDLAAAVWRRDVVSVLLNNGDGSLASKVDYPTGSVPSGLVAADFDGDGDEDLATANWGSNTASVLSNNGNGSFAPPVAYRTARRPEPLVAADLDADSDQDLVVGNQSSRSVSVLLNLLDTSAAADTRIALGEDEGRLPNLPEAYTLSQNYPNPFNSGTAIRFALPHREEMELTVYNLAGQKVVTLVEGLRDAGVYKVHWDGRNGDRRELASGVYLYRLRAGTQVETRKSLLLR